MCADGVDPTWLRGLPGELDADAAALLRAEYEHLATSFITNEEAGERRVGVLLTLIAAAIAAIGLGADRIFAEPSRLAVIVPATSTILLLYGLVTLRRIMGRNLATTDYLRGLSRIRAAFIRAHPAILDIVPFVPGTVKPRERKPWWGLGKAGYLEVVAATNAIIAALGIGGIVRPFTEAWPAVGIAAALAVILAWLAQMAWVRSVYRAETEASLEGRSRALEAWRAELGG